MPTISFAEDGALGFVESLAFPAFVPGFFESSSRTGFVEGSDGNFAEEDAPQPIFCLNPTNIRVSFFLKISIVDEM